MDNIGLTTGRAARYLGLHPKTLQRFDREGRLPAQRTATGRRFWNKRDLDVFLGKITIDGPRRVIAYCRVSSGNQRPDLKNQRKVLEGWIIASGLSNVDFIEEVGGGLNLLRKGFVALEFLLLEEYWC
jgi:excisionase family DNA binding protein